MCVGDEIMVIIDIILDKNSLVENGCDYEKSIALLCDVFEKSGFIQLKCEDLNVIYKGISDNLEDDERYLNSIKEYLFNEKWFICSMDKFLVSYFKNGKEVKVENAIIHYYKKFMRSIYD